MVGVTHQKHLDKVAGALFKFRLRDTNMVTIHERFMTGYESWRCYTPIHPPVLGTLSALLRLVHTTSCVALKVVKIKEVPISVCNSLGYWAECRQTPILSSATCTQKNFYRTRCTSPGRGLRKPRCPQSSHCWEAQGI